MNGYLNRFWTSMSKMMKNRDCIKLGPLGTLTITSRRPELEITSDCGLSGVQSSAPGTALRGVWNTWAN